MQRQRRQVDGDECRDARTEEHEKELGCLLGREHVRRQQDGDEHNDDEQLQRPWDWFIGVDVRRGLKKQYDRDYEPTANADGSPVVVSSIACSQIIPHFQTTKILEDFNLAAVPQLVELKHMKKDTALWAPAVVMTTDDHSREMLTVTNPPPSAYAL